MVLDGGAAVDLDLVFDLAASTTCCRHCLLEKLFPTLLRCPKYVSSVRDGSMLAIAQLIYFGDLDFQED